MRHFHSIAVAQILHFAHSHGEKQKQDFIFHCKYLHKQLLSWQTRLPTLITDKKKSSWYLLTPIPLSRLFTYNEWWFLFYVYLMQKFIEAHPVFAAKAWMEKWKLKKNTHTHRAQIKRWTFEFQRAPWTSHGATLMENALELFTLQTRYL